MNQRALSEFTRRGCEKRFLAVRGTADAVLRSLRLSLRADMAPRPPLVLAHVRFHEPATPLLFWVGTLCSQRRCSASRRAGTAACAAARFDAYDVQIFVRTIWTSTVAIRMLFKMAQVWSFMLLSRSVYSLWRRVFTIAIATSGFLPQKSRQFPPATAAPHRFSQLGHGHQRPELSRSDVTTLIEYFRH
jgi:hypothetical protein